MLMSYDQAEFRTQSAAAPHGANVAGISAVEAPGDLRLLLSGSQSTDMFLEVLRNSRTAS
ncbi:hypothetical protein D7003_02400 [Arthrobacter oryzae]|uniref:Uncharacterized protein n=1 Tax=Arthrobacter oryzae TaxID=409290 RepID=A0A3N0C9M5_9MICC|nr:hypothetical protein D7003_02400 [Arthrobacter oryzae]